MIVCSRVDRVAAATVVPGTEKRECAYCDAELWVAPSSVLMVQTDVDARLACSVCAERMAEAKPTRPVPLTEEQEADLARRPDQTEEL